MLSLIGTLFKQVMNYYVLPLVKEDQKSTETKSGKAKGGGGAAAKKKKK